MLLKSKTKLKSAYLYIFELELYIKIIEATYMERKCNIPSNASGIMQVMALESIFLEEKKRKLLFVRQKINESIKTYCEFSTYRLFRLDRPVNILLCTSLSLFSDKRLQKINFINPSMIYN